MALKNARESAPILYFSCWERGQNLKSMLIGSSEEPRRGCEPDLALERLHYWLFGPGPEHVAADKAGSGKARIEGLEVL